MRVRIHETRRERRIAQIDDARFLGNRQAAAGIDDLVALDDHHAVGHERLCFSVEEARRFKRDDLISGASWDSQHDQRKHGREPEAERLFHACEYEIHGSNARSQPRWLRSFR